MSTPRRIQLRRTKGWRMPPDTVHCGRPFRWGNPYPVTVYGLDESLRLYETEHLPRIVDQARRELRGKDLACWCRPDQRCHADLLLRQVNQ